MIDGKLIRLYEIVKRINEGHRQLGDREEVNRLSDELNSEGITDIMIERQLEAFDLTERVNKTLHKVNGAMRTW